MSRAGSEAIRQSTGVSADLTRTDSAAAGTTPRSPQLSSRRASDAAVALPGQPAPGSARPSRQSSSMPERQSSIASQQSSSGAAEPKQGSSTSVPAGSSRPSSSGSARQSIEAQRQSMEAQRQSSTTSRQSSMGGRPSSSSGGRAVPLAVAQLQQQVPSRPVSASSRGVALPLAEQLQQVQEDSEGAVDGAQAGQVSSKGQEYCAAPLVLSCIY